ncbi:alpha/beta hydrolase [Microbacterium sp. CFH 90308]|uniref:Alpha/beta hydrolase n=1 Tax=Microbacterium salsuginis TaxID=2722803 RepID=A0ABX1K6A4_9MICO|nr:alpha/beta hydrolase [Microbacterium sp. CFH 90308]NLP82544.1 alpha/beta hydrolase [Microbacterium sp. CFH 90308]
MDASTPRLDPTAKAWSPPLPEAPGFEHLVVETPGVRRHVATMGAGEPVLLLHGFPGHWWQWHAIAPLLAEHGYRAICPDLRGSGWTESDDPAFHRETQLSDVLAVLDGMGIERAHVIAHDMGAISAMQLSYGRPHRVRAVVQLAVPPGFMEFSPRLIPAFRHLPKLLLHRPPASVGYLFNPAYQYRPFTEDETAAYLAPEQRPEVLASVHRMYRGMVVPVSMQLMRGDFKRVRLQPPTLFVFGREDSTFSEDVVRTISRNHERRAARAEFAFVEKASHFIPEDAPTAVAELALDWFRRAG